MQPSMDKSRGSSNNPPKQNHMPYPPTNDSENLKALSNKHVALELTRMLPKCHSHKHVALNQMTWDFYIVLSIYRFCHSYIILSFYMKVLSFYLLFCCSICLSVCLSVYLSIVLSIYRSVILSIVLSLYLTFYRSIYCSVVLSVCLSVYPSIYLSFYLSIRAAR